MLTSKSDAEELNKSLLWQISDLVPKACSLSCLKSQHLEMEQEPCQLLIWLAYL